MHQLISYLLHFDRLLPIDAKLPKLSNHFDAGIQPLYTTSELDFKNCPDHVDQALEDSLKNIDLVSNSLGNLLKRFDCELGIEI